MKKLGISSILLIGFLFLGFQAKALNISGTSWDYNAWGGLTPSTPVTQSHVIPPGMSLTLNGNRIYFAQGVTLTVSTGATLTATDCKFRSVNGSSTWGGIRINGFSALPQNSSQGRFIATRDTFTNASIAIRANSGGILTMNEGRVRNPVLKGIVLESYPLESISVIQGAKFDYSKAVSSTWPGKVKMIDLRGICGVNINNNFFENAMPATNFSAYKTERGTAIAAAVANAHIQYNVIKQFDQGIDLTFNNTAPINNCCNSIVEFNVLKNNYTGIELAECDGVLLAHNDLVNNGVFENAFSFLPTTSPMGIKVLESTNTHITANEVTRKETAALTRTWGLFAIYVLNEFGTSPTTHIEGNITWFDLDASKTGNHYGITLVGDHLNTKVTCNTHIFDPDRLSGQTGWYINGTMGTVGSTQNASNAFVNLQCNNNNMHIDLKPGNPAFLYNLYVGNPYAPTQACSSPPIVFMGNNNRPTCVPTFAHFAGTGCSSGKTSNFVEEKSTEDDFLSIAPNPNTGDELHVTLSETLDGSIEIFTLNGQKVANYPMNQIQQSFRLDHLPSGLYFLRHSARPSLSKKLILSR